MLIIQTYTHAHAHAHTHTHTYAHTKRNPQTLLDTSYPACAPSIHTVQMRPMVAPKMRKNKNIRMHKFSGKKRNAKTVTKSWEKNAVDKMVPALVHLYFTRLHCVSLYNPLYSGTKIRKGK